MEYIIYYIHIIKPIKKFKLNFLVFSGEGYYISNKPELASCPPPHVVDTLLFESVTF